MDRDYDKNTLGIGIFLHLTIGMDLKNEKFKYT